MKALVQVSAFRKASNPSLSELNARIAAVAGRQGGHVTRAQLREMGVLRGGVRARLKAGWLFRVHRGVYAVGHLPTNPLDRARGALLAAGARSALHHRSAAAHWELYRRWPQAVEVISPLQHRIPTVKASRCATLLQRDIQ